MNRNLVTVSLLVIGLMVGLVCPAQAGLMVEVRATGVTGGGSVSADGRAVTGLAPGSVVQFAVFSVVTGEADPAGSGPTLLSGGILSSSTGAAGIAGTIGGGAYPRIEGHTTTRSMGGTGATLGNSPPSLTVMPPLANVNDSADLDWGSTSQTSDLGWWAWSSQAGVGVPQLNAEWSAGYRQGTSGTYAPVPGPEYQAIGMFTYTVGSVAPGEDVLINFVPRSSPIATTNAQWKTGMVFDDNEGVWVGGVNHVAGATPGNEYIAGAPVVLDAPPVPEPSVLVLLGCGALGLGWFGLRRRS